MNSFKRFFAFILGAVFTVSGVVKLIDPVGTGLIVSEYFNWMHLDFMRPAAKMTGEMLSLAETLTGAALLAGVWRKLTALLASCMLAFFTAISIALVISDPVMDCGCFGEFVHLTHGQTLLKNIILCVLAFIAFTPVWSLGITRRRKYAEFLIACAMICALAVYSWRNIPWADFTDYKPSVTLTTDGFSDSSDVTATFTIWNEYGDDVSEDILFGDVALITIYHPDKLTQEQKGSLARFASAAWNHGLTPYVVSTSMVEIPGAECFYGDYKSIITINRSNGGATLLSDGMICSKRSARHIYSETELEKISSLGASEYCVEESLSKSVISESAALLYFLIFLI